jgi:catechol 2,3-dioxygenase-like lactoylglutathione lyase family enzyme
MNDVSLLGVHHVRLPVSSLTRSSEWYATVLGFECLVVEEDEDRVTGLVMQHPGGVMIGLHEDRDRAAALRGFAAIAFSVPDVAAWSAHLDAIGIDYGPPEACHLGTAIRLADPDGIVVHLHSVEQPSADEA